MTIFEHCKFIFSFKYNIPLSWKIMKNIKSFRSRSKEQLNKLVFIWIFHSKFNKNKTKLNKFRKSYHFTYKTTILKNYHSVYKFQYQHFSWWKVKHALEIIILWIRKLKMKSCRFDLVSSWKIMKLARMWIIIWTQVRNYANLLRNSKYN